MILVFTSLIPLLNPPRAGGHYIGVQLTSSWFPPTLREKIVNHFLQYFSPTFTGECPTLFIPPFTGEIKRG